MFYYRSGKINTDTKTESKQHNIRQNFKNYEVRGSSMFSINVVRGAEGENELQARVG